MNPRRCFACAVLGAAVLVQNTPVRAQGTNDRLVSYAAASTPATPCVRGGVRGAALWDKARYPEARRLCGLLLLGNARLRDEPEMARDLGLEAAELAPDRAEPWVLVARAQVLLGEPSLASTSFERALRLDAAALDAPNVLLAAARAEVQRGNSTRALEHYRRLAPRVSLLSDGRERQKALIEASLVAQVVSPESYPEARAYAVEARRSGALFFTEFSRAVLALALDRAGRSGEARALAAEAEGPWALRWLIEGEPEPRGRATELRPVLPPGEQEALVAILAEPVDRELARDAWSSYLERAKSAATPYPPHLVEHAARRLRELGG